VIAPELILLITTVLAWTGVVQATSLALVFLSQRHNPSPGSQLLAVQYALLAVLSAAVLLSHTGPTEGSLSLEVIEQTSWLLSGPLMLIFLKKTLGLAAPSLLHLVPAVLALTVSSTRFTDLPIGLFMVHQLGYTTYGLVLYRIAAAPTAREDWWCRALFMLLLPIHAAQLLRYLFSGVAALENIVPATTAVGILALTIRALRRSELIRGSLTLGTQDDSLPSPDPELTLPPATTSPSLRGEDTEAVLTNKRLFLDTERSVQALAERLGVPRSGISAAINRDLDTSFLDLLSRYRVEEAMKLLRDPELDHLTVEAIGRRSGFRTRSTFYQRFRKHVGQTPSSFRMSE